MTILIFIISIILTYLAIRYPPGIACIFLILSISQTFGVGAILPGALSFIIGLIALIGGCVSFLKLWHCHKYNKVASRTFFIAVIAAISSLWPGLAIFANGGSIVEIIDVLTTNGIFGVIIVLAYWDNQWARKLVVATILVQLIISVGILQYPNSPLFILKASFYNSVYNVDYDNLGSVKSEYVRQSGQFLNTLQLSFYAASGLIIGLYLLFTSRFFYQRIVGIVLSLLALLCTYFSFSRGGGISLIVGAIVLIAWQPLKYRISIVMLLFCVVISVLVMEPDFSSLSGGNDFLSYVVKSFSETTSGESDLYRFRALSESMSVLVDYPLFGTGNIEAYLREKSFMPHQAPLTSAVLYGWPEGICVAILFWVVIAGCFSQMKQLFAFRCAENIAYRDHIDSTELRLATILGLMVIIFGMTNGHSGKMIQYVSLGYACLPWIYNCKINDNVKMSALSR